MSGIVVAITTFDNGETVTPPPTSVPLATAILYTVPGTNGSNWSIVHWRSVPGPPEHPQSDDELPVVSHGSSVN